MSFEILSVFEVKVRLVDFVLNYISLTYFFYCSLLVKLFIVFSTTGVVLSCENRNKY